MTTLSAVQPVWAQSAFLRAVWVATAESPEWIAARTDSLLSELHSALGVASWRTHHGGRWEGPPDALADIVREFVNRDRPTAEHPDGEVLAADGYGISLSGAGSGLELTVRISAGCVSPGRRVPRHNLSIDVRETVTGTVTGLVGDAICAAVASTWHPASFELSDTPTSRAARRGGWKIGIGYRIWINAEVGTISQAANGLAATKLAKGTLISAPDVWPAERVVAAMVETLDLNGLDEIPH